MSRVNFGEPLFNSHSSSYFIVRTMMYWVLKFTAKRTSRAEEEPFNNGDDEDKAFVTLLRRVCVTS